MFSKRCRGCLGLADEDADGKNNPCEVCGTITDDLTSVCLQNLVEALGKKMIWSRISSDLNLMATRSEMRMLHTGVDGETVDTGAIFKAISLNVESVVSANLIHKDGIREVTRLILEHRKFLADNYGININFAEAAVSVARLFDVKKGTMAPLIIQKVPQKAFCLANYTPKEETIHLNPRIASVKIISGKGDIVYNPVDEMECAVLIKTVEKLPLIIAYGAERDEDSRLFIFV